MLGNNKKRTLRQQVLAAAIAFLLFFQVPASARATYIFDDLFGRAMPSLEFVTHRKYDAREEGDDGLWLVWDNVKEEDYTGFSRYLAANGFVLAEWKSEEDVLYCTIEDAGSGDQMTMAYDRKEGRIRLLYPDGTRPEDTPGAGAEKEGGGILPPISKAFGSPEMPNPENPLRRRADSVSVSEDGALCMSFHDIGESEFTLCNDYFRGKGCATAEQSLNGRVLSVTLALRGCTFGYVYDSTKRELRIIYPAGVAAEAYSPDTLATADPYIDPHPVGSTIRFGHYEQDGIQSNGNESLEWIILEKRDGSALLLSAKALEAMPYHEEGGAVNWSGCSLRVWLNDIFLNSAFSMDERAAILETTVDNGPEQGRKDWIADGGAQTRDRIFLLSYHEAFEVYFDDDGARTCLLSISASDHGAFGWWWLRSPGEIRRMVSVVDKTGQSNEYSVASIGAVRPALWVDLAGIY